MKRVKFIGSTQRDFLNLVILRLDSPSLRGLLQFGLNIPYSTLRNYYNNTRLIPENLFKDMCELARIDEKSLGVKYIKGSWGQVKGGKISKR